MDVGLIVKIAGFSIILAILNTVLRQVQKDELAQLLLLAGVAIIALMVFQLVNDLFQTVRTMFQLY
ncbi:MAG: stage III sporulation protein AC [bacterium]|nr:stage III sporulation protein AC [bacterium]